MEEQTKTITYTQAGLLQMNAAQFNCKIKELGVTGSESVKAVVEGTPENLKGLFEYIDNATEKVKTKSDGKKNESIR